MGCATSMVKYVVFLFNLIFALGGLALLIIGVLFKLSVGDYTDAIENQDENFALIPTLLIVIGCIVFVIAFFGCCGAIRESTCMLTTYAIILLVIFILQVAIGVFAFLQFKDGNASAKNEITRGLQTAVGKYYTDKSSEELMDVLQFNLHCCGAIDSKDYSNVNLPKTCCPGKPDSCTRPIAFDDGCAEDLWEYLKSSVKLIGIVAIAIAAAELIGAIVALCLSSSIRNQERRGAYA